MKKWWNPWYKKALEGDEPTEVVTEEQTGPANGGDEPQAPETPAPVPPRHRMTKEKLQGFINAGRGYDAAVALLENRRLQSQFDPKALFGMRDGQIKPADLFRVIKAEGLNASEVLIPEFRKGIAEQNQKNVNALYEQYIKKGINYALSPKFKVINDAITSMGFPMLVIDDEDSKVEQWLNNTKRSIKQFVKDAVIHTPNASDEEITNMIMGQEGPYEANNSKGPTALPTKLTIGESLRQFGVDLKDHISNLIYAEKNNPDHPNYAITKTPADVKKLREKGVTDGNHHKEFPYVTTKSSVKYGDGIDELGSGEYFYSFALNSSDELELANGRTEPFPEEIFRRMDAHSAGGDKPVGFVFGTYTPREALWVAEIQSDLLQRSSYIGRSFEEAEAKINALVAEINARWEGKEDEMSVEDSRKIKKLLWNLNPSNSYGYVSRKSSFMPEQPKAMRSRIENYFGGFNRMAMNTVLSFAKDKQIPVVYVNSAETLAEKWSGDGDREELLAMFVAEYDAMAQNIYGATKEGTWWKIPVAGVLDKIAKQDVSGLTKRAWSDRWTKRAIEDEETPGETIGVNEQMPPEETPSEATVPETAAPVAVPEAPKTPRRNITLKMVEKMIAGGKYADAIDAIVSNKRIAQQVDWDKMFAIREMRLRVWLDIITQLGLDPKQVFPPKVRKRIGADIEKKLAYMFNDFKNRGQNFLKTEVYARIKRMGELVGFNVEEYVKENLSSEIYNYPMYEHTKTEEELARLRGDEKTGAPRITDSSHRQFPYTIVPMDNQPGGQDHGAEGTYDFSFAINSVDNIFPEEIFTTLNKHDAAGKKPAAFVFGKYTPGKVLYVSEMQSDVIQRSQMYLQSYDDAVAKFKESTQSLRAAVTGKDMPKIVVDGVWTRETKKKNDKVNARIKELISKLPKRTTLAPELIELPLKSLLLKIHAEEEAAMKQRIETRLQSLENERTGKTKAQMKERIKKNTEAIGDAKGWEEDFMPQYEHLRSKIQNYFSGWNIMALNTVLNFAKEHNIPTVYVIGARKLGHDWDSHTSGAFTEDMYRRLYDDTVQAHYGAKKAGDWWKIDVNGVSDRIASMTVGMVKMAEYDKLYEKYPITMAGEEIKNDLKKDPKVRAFVEATMSADEWAALTIGFWGHIPFYDEVKKAVYLPTEYRMSIEDIGKEYAYPDYSGWQGWPGDNDNLFAGMDAEDFRMWIEDEGSMMQAEGATDEEVEMFKDESYVEWQQHQSDKGTVAPAIPFKPEMKKETMKLTETETRMILHELNHYVDHMNDSEQFVTETTGYFKDDAKEDIDMKKYLKSPAERRSFMAEMKYMLENGSEEMAIIRKMQGEYGGPQSMWEELLDQVKVPTGV